MCCSVCVVFVLVSRFPCTHNVMARGWNTHDRAHGVGGQGWDGPVLWRPARHPTGDRRHRGGTDGLPRQPAEGMPLASFVHFKCICMRWNYVLQTDIKLLRISWHEVFMCLCVRWPLTLWPASPPPPGTDPTPESLQLSPWWVSWSLWLQQYTL